jgi:hypothetical protein
MKKVLFIITAIIAVLFGSILFLYFSRNTYNFTEWNCSVAKGVGTKWNYTREESWQFDVLREMYRMINGGYLSMNVKAEKVSVAMNDIPYLDNSDIVKYLKNIVYGGIHLVIWEVPRFNDSLAMMIENDCGIKTHGVNRIKANLFITSGPKSSISASFIFHENGEIVGKFRREYDGKKFHKIPFD